MLYGGQIKFFFKTQMQDKLTVYALKQSKGDNSLCSSIHIPQSEMVTNLLLFTPFNKNMQNLDGVKLSFENEITILQRIFGLTPQNYISYELLYFEKGIDMLISKQYKNQQNMKFLI